MLAFKKIKNKVITLFFFIIGMFLGRYLALPYFYALIILPGIYYFILVLKAINKKEIELNNFFKSKK